MIKILITGKNSYIGNSFKDYVHNNNVRFDITEIGTHGNEWKDHNFSSYDVIFHVAGIAHNSSDIKLKELYYKVNRDLTLEIAKKAKLEGVKQFIFMSSMIIFGNNKNGLTRIDKNSSPNPDNFYGDSKLKAEEGLALMNDAVFKVVILRPPMIYGSGSKGNYPLLSKLAQKTIVFPNYSNKRSMLYIENLCEFIRLIIVNSEDGVFHPQNKELVETSRMVKLIAEIHGHKIFFTRLFNPLLKKLIRINLIKKVFGDLYYDSDLSNYDDGNYQIYSLEESLKLTEGD